MPRATRLTQEPGLGISILLVVEHGRKHGVQLGGVLAQHRFDSILLAVTDRLNPLFQHLDLVKQVIK